MLKVAPLGMLELFEEGFCSRLAERKRDVSREVGPRDSFEFGNELIDGQVAQVLRVEQFRGSTPAVDDYCLVLGGVAEPRVVLEANDSRRNRHAARLGWPQRREYDQSEQLGAGAP